MLRNKTYQFMTADEVNDIATHIAQALTDAWNESNGSLFAEAFTDDAVFVNVFGEMLNSKDEIASGHQLILDHAFKGTTIKYSLLDAGQIDANTILSHNRGSMLLTGNQDALTMTLIIVKQNQKWLIRALHNSTVVQNPSKNQ